MRGDQAEELLWDEWFDRQYELVERIERAVKGASEGRTDSYRAALWAGVLEYGAERIRMYLTLKEEPDVQSDPQVPEAGL